MAYVAPYIDATGMHIPTYTEVRDELIAQMKTIFGSDIYITEDTQDYQQISILAKKIHDTNSLALLAYNNRTPNTSIGVGLDNMCSIVGITRKPATYSIVQLTITGTAGTVISNGQATDGTYVWDLPASVTIPDTGSITVSATCDTIGKITAAANTITTIVTPVYGWTGVTNNQAVSGTNLGSNVESDASLRGRFALATELPSSTVFDGMIAAIQNVEDVTRVKGYENDTGVTSTEGFPPHSVTFIVEGGDDEDIATEIYYKKTPGCYTNGTTEVSVTSISGNITIIRFTRPDEKEIYAKVYLTPLSSYSSSYPDKIKAAIVEYIEGLQIADSVYRSVLTSVAIAQMDSIASPAYSITKVELSTDGTTYSEADISMDFDEVATITAANITVVVSNA